MARPKTAHDVKHILHRDVFHPNKDRILSFIQVSKTEPGFGFNKGENVHYLCLYVTTKRPYQASIARFKKADQGEEYVRRRQWSLEELTKIDGKSTSSACLGFELWSNTAFKFEALTNEDKGKFLDDLADACQHYLQTQPPQFLNVSAKTSGVVKKAAADISQLEKTKQQLNERGEKISELETKTSEMAHSAESFAENAHKLATQYAEN